MTLLDITIKLPSDKHFKMTCLADCAFLSEIFATEFVELEKHDSYRRRLVNMRGHQFTEKVIHLCDSELIYQMEGNRPVKNHRGEINYIQTANGDYLHYKIEGQSNTWVPTWLLKIVMYYDFTLAGKRLWRSVNGC